MKNIEEFYPLSPTQQGILFHTIYAPESGVYVEQLSFDIQGDLSISSFQQVWQQLIERHPILRTSFIWEDIKEPVQVVHKQIDLPWQQEDLSGIDIIEQQKLIETHLLTERKQGFEISQAPLMNLKLLHLAEKNYKFIWTHHHLILDGWSSSLLLQDLFTCYQELSQGKDISLQKHRPYRDYIAWSQKQNLSKSETFWKQYLKGFTTVTSLGVEQNFNSQVSENKNYATSVLRLSNIETAALQSFARQQQLTLNTIVQGAWAILLNRYIGENDIVFGGVVSGRPTTLTGVESMVGVFINTLPVRVKFNPQQLLIPWLKQLQIQQNEVRQYEYTPLIEIQKWSEIPAGQLLFASIFNFQNYPINSSLQQPIHNLKISNVNSFIHPHYPLNISVQVDAELSLEVFYDRHHFDDDKINRMLGHLKTLLLGMVTNPQQHIGELPLLTATERYQLLEEWNNTQVDYPQDQCIHQLFEAQVEKTPDAVAVVFENEQLTYEELNNRANQLAHYLQKLGVRPEVLVGICVERSLEMVVGLLAILKAGGAYVPLDPSYPQERISFILEDTQAPVLLTQVSLLEEIPQHKAQVVCLDTDWHLIAQQSQENVCSELTTDNLAYTIYTSGSTGKPKGVQIPHSALSNFSYSMRQAPGLTSQDTLLAVTTYSFDIAALELFLPIVVGARLVVASREVALDGIQLSAKIIDSGATVIQATPATWHLLLASGWDGNDRLKILCGGEALSTHLASQILQRCGSLWNMYGPTETTIWSTASEIKPDGKIIPISNPIGNTQLYILDQYSQLVPVGIIGELCISGEGLARGYFHRPDLSAEKFIPNPFSEDKESGRLYKTGDLARYLANGDIEYLGRIDNQVKVRGFRIELGEIETVINQYPGVRETVVTVREDSVGSQQIVAYVVPQKEQTLASSQLRSFLELKLPNYMVPSAFVVLEALPLTPSGKVDRKALSVPENTSWELGNAFVAPRHPVEELLAGIWSQVLGISQVGINDNFFEIGGHSLLATQVISRIRKTCAVDISLQRLFEFPTIAQLAKDIQQASSKNISSITPVPRTENLPLSFAQARLWLLEQLKPGSYIYNMPALIRLVGDLNIEVLEQSINEIINRHEVLRTNFVLADEQPLQKILPKVQLKISVANLRELTEAEQKAEINRFSVEEFQHPFDFTQAPLLRCKLLQIGEQEYILLFVIHHIVFDGWSTGVFIRELATLYTAFAMRETSPLPALPIQYADFAVWQRQHLQGERRESLLTYWKKQLVNLTVLQLPTIRPRPEVKTNRGASHNFVIPASVVQKVRSLSQGSGVTLFMTLLASFKVLLQRYTNQDDIIVGTDVANRNQAELEELIGFFVNLLVLRTDLSGNPTFLELLQRIRTQTLAAYAHQDLPFDELVRELKPERHLSNTVPLFQVLFVLQNTPTSALELPGLTLKLLETENNIARFDIALFLTETEQGIEGKWQYNADLFVYDTITQLTNHWQTLINSIVNHPQSHINTLEMLTEAEKVEQNMQKQERKSAKRKKFMSIAPKAVSLSVEELIKTGYLQEEQKFPLVIQPNSSEIDFISWTENNQEYLEKELLKHGAILFRGFNIQSALEFENFAQTVCPNLFADYGDLPRTDEGGKIYGSTPYPADKTILFHNESSHLHCFPLKIWFYCVQPAVSGGETPIVDCRKAYRLLNPQLREKLASKQLMYVRNFADGLDVSWQNFFQTTDKNKVENYCRQVGIDFEWYDNNGLITRQIRPALAVHPKTKEPVFFNQIQLHHISYLDTDVRDSLLSIFGESKLPRNVYFGDSKPITATEIAEINIVYQQSQASFPWQKGDIIMLDNMLAAHGRNPYIGQRKIVVAMGEMINGKNINTP
ncbi:non-ribosomal peptide synthetase [Mastigocoleus testarum]|uniref:Non-ribosomal peptide synthetase n=1 Tax=Mastigocoleus testarum BC008 TaxID=371196 RepID=A0A0V7ZN87_9CYAN|nr:non-ribosomal peptide synthetase [Mastigocoleus testarum]KST65996.1 non-ribosomal peptide synthetase [Mastigocoleus testarum BC008]